MLHDVSLSVPSCGLVLLTVRNQINSHPLNGFAKSAEGLMPDAALD